MPRGEARIFVSVWDQGGEFVALPMEAQWLYFALCSQLELNNAGVIKIPRREWSNLCVDDDAADRIARARKVLEERRYIVVDDTTDELLVRSYIRTRIEKAPPGTFRSAMDAVTAVSSPLLRRVLHRELGRLDRDVVATKGAANGERPIVALDRALDATDMGPDDPDVLPMPDDPLADETTAKPDKYPMRAARPSDAHPTKSVRSASDAHRQVKAEAEAEAEAEVESSSSGGDHLGGSRAGAGARTRTRGRRGRRTTQARGDPWPVQPCGIQHDPGPPCGACATARRVQHAAASSGWSSLATDLAADNPDTPRTGTDP